MQNKKRNGFTLTELIVVIAIIGILLAVLIPLLTGYIGKAQVSNDTRLVRNLNAALADDSALNLQGAKHENMTEALKAAKNEGYDVGKINASKRDNEILWDSKNDVFVYYNTSAEDGKQIEYIPNSVKEGEGFTSLNCQLWRIKDVTNGNLTGDNEPCSVYAKTSTVDTITTDKGFDAGKVESITSVSYTHSGATQTVVIRTNGGTLTVNAPSDDVHHYGYAEKVDVKDVKATSYHENGDVDLIKVQKGHVELEAAAKVLGVYVYTEDASAGFADIKITVNQGTEIPQLSRSAVVIDDEGTKVCTVVTDQAKDIYLFNEGIYEQIKVADEGANKSTAEWVDKVEAGASENTQNAAWQLANEYNGTRTNGSIDDKSVEITEGENAGTYTVKFNEDSRTFETYTTGENPTLVEDVNVINETTAVAVDQSGSSEAAAIADLPLRGDGLSWETAFEIYDYATMQKINDYAGQDRYFKVVIEKTDNGHIDLDNWSYIYMDGHFDGSGVIFDNLDCVLFYGPYASEQFDAKNFTISESCSISGWRTGAAVLYDGAPENHLSNITVHGYIQGSDRAAAFVGWGTYSFGTQKWYFDNCYSDATLVGSDVGGFIAHPYNNNGQKGSAYVSCYAYAYFNDSLFEGVMQTSKTPNYINGNNCSATAGSAVYMNFSNASLLSRFNAVCKTTLGTNTNGNGYTYVYGQNNSATPFNSMSDYLKRTSIETTNHTLEGMSLGDTFSASKNANATKAIITFNVGPNGKTESGNFVGTYLKDEYTSLNDEIITSNNVRYYTIAVNPTGVEETGVTGTQLNIVGEQYGTTYGSASVTIAQYNSNGYLVQLDVWILPVE